MAATVVFPAGLSVAQSAGGTTPPATGAVAAPAGSVNNGMMLFATDGCFECHDYGGTGASTGPRIAKTALPFAAFLMQLRMPASQMPPFEASVVSDQQVADIYAYLEAQPAAVNMSSVTLPH